MCVSGQCYLSAALGGRSGNRGLCAQPCRLPFSAPDTPDLTDGFALSLKDQSLVQYIPALQQAGVTSLKIEGRMKRPEYVAAAVSACRAAVNGETVPREMLDDLEAVFSRSGFTDGYYTSFAGREMMSIERPKPWGLKVGIVDKYLEKPRKVTIRTREALVPGDGIEIWTQNEPHVGSNVSKHSKAGEVITLTMEGDIQKNDVVYRTYGKALNDEIRKTWKKDRRKLPIPSRRSSISSTRSVWAMG
jgi:putative protease